MSRADDAVRIEPREVPPRVAWALEHAGVHPLLARLYAARGVTSADELDESLAGLLPPDTLAGAADAAALLADAIGAASRICVVADYDCDGATACATLLRGLVQLGADRADLGYVVPDRRLHGYGLTPAIVDLAIEAHAPDVLVTVDNGIASLEGVAHARERGLAVVVTDHHLPARVDGAVVLPEADVVVDPSQPGCRFASKQLAGCGVAFYVLLALRAELRARGEFHGAPTVPSVAAPHGGAAGLGSGSATGRPREQPRLDALLDLVALGTVADVVRLDRNNRLLVAAGLRRVRAGRMQPGLAALFAVAGRDPREASAADFGFAIGPRLNAAGRLADMTLGIECLLADDASRAGELAQALDAINRERRGVEGGMREQAEAMVEAAIAETAAVAPAYAVHHASFHEGVVGIVAARLKDRLQRPTFVFATARDGMLKGSGRSVEGLHLRDALDWISKQRPALLVRFGGHAMAAGCTIDAGGLDAFRALFCEAVPAIGALPSERRVASDGTLAAAHWSLDTARLLRAQVWGAAFEEPVFSADAELVGQRLVGEKHLRLALRIDGVMRDAIWFGRSEPVEPGARGLHVAWRLGVDRYEGLERVGMTVVAAVPLA